MEEETQEHNQCFAVSEDATSSLTSAYQYFIKALNEKLPISLVPSVQPKSGSVFVYDLGPDPDKWEGVKKKLRLVFAGYWYSDY